MIEKKQIDMSTGYKQDIKQKLFASNSNLNLIQAKKITKTKKIVSFNFKSNSILHKSTFIFFDIVARL